MKSIATLALLLAPAAACLCDTDNPVSWTAKIEHLKPASDDATLRIEARIGPGWHVYGLYQAAGGPTPLLVNLDSPAGFETRGPLRAEQPVKRHDPAFDLDTTYYFDHFHADLPLRRTDVLVSQVTLNVRYQVCSERNCKPPTTIQLQAPWPAPGGP